MKKKDLVILILSLFMPLFFCCGIETELFLKENLRRAKSGDYLVTLQNKNYTVLLIRSNDSSQMSIEEITIPMARIPNKSGQALFSWKQWIEKGAPKNTGWLMYKIGFPEGTIQQAYSYTKNEWVAISQTQNFLSTLLNLKLQRIPQAERRKVGPKHPSETATSDSRRVWEPRMIVEGKTIPGVAFNGWRARWPKDGSELSGKVIEVYLPRDEGNYPSYFPYWLQIIGMTGKAKVRIIDSGTLSH